MKKMDFDENNECGSSSKKVINHTQKNLVSKTQLGITKKLRGFNNWIEIWRIYEGEGKMNVRYG
jgi:hypothetical protein